jgi:hypothetical protein
MKTVYITIKLLPLITIKNVKQNHKPFQKFRKFGFKYEIVR